MTNAVVPDVQVSSDFHCGPCKRDFKNKHALKMHQIVVHQRQGYIGRLIAKKAGKRAAKKQAKALSLTKSAKRKVGRPKGSTSKPKAGYCVLCQRQFKSAHGLTIHNAQTNHETVTLKSNDKGMIANANVSRTQNRPQFSNEEVNLAFLSGALCERVILSPRVELLAELITGRLSAARMANSQVR